MINKDFNRLDNVNTCYLWFQEAGPDFKKDADRYQKKRDEILSELSIS